MFPHSPDNASSLLENLSLPELRRLRAIDIPSA
jgi:hypothetical protein